MVFQNPDALGAAVTHDTNIDKAILNDLLEMQQKSGSRPSLNEIPAGGDKSGSNAARISPNIPEEDPEIGYHDQDYADLPDLSDLEKMIDWDDVDDLGEPPASWCRN